VIVNKRVRCRWSSGLPLTKRAAGKTAPTQDEKVKYLVETPVNRRTTPIDLMKGSP
jgi:hypothetical protein